MEAKELRVGNYVKNLVSQSFGIDKTLVVSAIFSNREHPVNACDPEIYPNLGSVCESPIGIPLTEEWLEKFGFSDADYKDGYIGKDFKSNLILDFVLTKPKKLGDFQKYYVFELGCHRILMINYVHELQNLYFSITKQELTWNRSATS